MPEISWPVLVGSLVLFVVIAVFFVPNHPACYGEAVPEVPAARAEGQDDVSRVWHHREFPH